MSGMKPSKRSAAHRQQGAAGDPCDVRIRIDLMSVRSEVAQKLHAGELLQVVLHVEGGLRAVICQTSQGEVVGALSAFPGLAQFVRCIEQGWRYSALVERSSSQSCTVFVARSSK